VTGQTQQAGWFSPVLFSWPTAGLHFVLWRPRTAGMEALSRALQAQKQGSALLVIQPSALATGVLVLFEHCVRQNQLDAFAEILDICSLSPPITYLWTCSCTQHSTMLRFLHHASLLIC
jgi:hypothetical protein